MTINKAPPRSEQFAEHAKRADDPVRRAELFLQAAHLAEDLEDDPTRATLFYRQSLEADPHQTTALVALERIYLRTSDWKALYIVYGLHADALHGKDRASARADLYGKMGRLALERLRDEELAAICYENLLEATPGAPDAVRFLVDLLEKRGDWRSIERLLRGQAPLVQDHVERSEFLRMLADALQFHLNRVPESIDLYREACKVDPLNVGAFKGLVTALDSESRSGELIDLLAARDAALQRFPGNPAAERELFEVRLQLADLLSMGSSGQRTRARQVLEAAASLQPKSEEVLRREAEFAVQEGNFRRGAKAYENLLRVTTPRSQFRSEVLITLAELYRTHIGRPEDAEKCLQEVIENYLADPMADHLVTAQRLMAELAWEKGNFEDAQTFYEALLEKTPQHETLARAEYHLRLGQIAEGMGQSDLALGHYNAILDMLPRFRRALRARANLLFEHGAWKEALVAQEDYLKAVGNADKDSPEIRTATEHIGECLENLGDFDRAEAQYVSMLRRGWESHRAREGLARIYEATGRTDEAAEQWQELRLEAATSGRDERWAEASEHLAGILEKRGDVQSALAFYEEIASRKPGRVLTHERLANLCAQQGRWGDAHKHYALLVKHLPPNAPEEARRRAMNLLEKAERNAFFEGDL